MLHRALIQTFFVLGTILTGLDSMKCYSCHGSGDSQCANNSTTAAVVQTCYSFENKETDKSAWQRLRPSKDQDNDVSKLEGQEVYSVDVKVVCSYFRQKASHMYGEVVVRGCQYIFNNRDFCEEMHKAYKSVLGCSVCDTELCN